MKRYGDTFFRYWFIVLIPIIVLPLAEYAMVKTTPRTYMATANILVRPSIAATAAAASGSWSTPAQSEMANLTQWLQSASFDLSVADGSPLYTRRLARVSNPRDRVFNDLIANVQIAAKGTSLLNISYTSKDAQLALEVVRSLLQAERDKMQALTQQSAAEGIKYYTFQLHAAQDKEIQSARQLADYMARHGVAADQLTTASADDLTLAALYQQNQSDRTQVTSAQQRVTGYQMQGSAAGSVDDGTYTVVDPPALIVVSAGKKQQLNLIIALLVGLLLGGAFMVIKTALDPSLRFADEVPTLLDLPVLGVVPYNRALAATRIGTSRVVGPARPVGLGGSRRSG